MTKGVIVRHLILPNHVQNSKNILKWIKDNLPHNTYVSVMAQYFPTNKAKSIEGINRKINLKEYKEIENYLYTLGLDEGYMQDLGEHEEEYVPNFDFRNI
jgi:putative pyruvate formate lyase activating enzyme